jgi:hypothetical protein
LEDLSEIYLNISENIEKNQLKENDILFVYFEKGFLDIESIILKSKNPYFLQILNEIKKVKSLFYNDFHKSRLDKEYFKSMDIKVKTLFNIIN